MRFAASVVQNTDFQTSAPCPVDGHPEPWRFDTAFRSLEMLPAVAVFGKLNVHRTRPVRAARPLRVP